LASAFNTRLLSPVEADLMEHAAFYHEAIHLTFSYVAGGSDHEAINRQNWNYQNNLEKKKHNRTTTASMY
jgi:hypothetical protein